MKLVEYLLSTKLVFLRCPVGRVPLVAVASPLTTNTPIFPILIDRTLPPTYRQPMASAASYLPHADILYNETHIK